VTADVTTQLDLDYASILYTFGRGGRIATASASLSAPLRSESMRA
jgi:hypothetical protein